jgi:serine O-acetyltransferase
MATDHDWQADVARWGLGRVPWREQSLWALWVYRFGRRADAQPAGLVQTLMLLAYKLLNTPVKTLTGISIQKDTRIGPGLQIWHFGNVVVHPQTVIGANCTLRQGVSLGERYEGGPCPVLEDDVDLGSHAHVLGSVRLGKGCRVGAMAVVLCDVPAGYTAAGNPARVLAPREARQPSSPE